MDRRWLRRQEYLQKERVCCPESGQGSGVAGIVRACGIASSSRTETEPEAQSQRRLEQTHGEESAVKLAIDRISVRGGVRRNSITNRTIATRAESPTARAGWGCRSTLRSTAGCA